MCKSDTNHEMWAIKSVVYVIRIQKSEIDQKNCIFLEFGHNWVYALGSLKITQF